MAKKIVEDLVKNQVMQGRVVVAKQPTTVTVLVERSKIHPLYKKSYKRSTKYLVNDLIGVTEGDLVRITKINPVSKMKHWQILDVVGRDITVAVTQKLQEGVDVAIAEVMPEEKEDQIAEKPASAIENQVEEVVAVKAKKPVVAKKAKAKKGEKKS